VERGASPRGGARLYRGRGDLAKQVATDLNTLIPKNSGWYLECAQGINDAGDIVGFGTINGSTHAFLATPKQ